MDSEEFARRLVGLRETRARLPELVRNRHASRRRRAFLGHRGRLVLVDADPPMIAATAPEGSPMLDRGTLLNRLADALALPEVDGVIATVDVVDDLLLLEQLDDRLALGILNHPGHADGWASDDGRPSGYAPAAIAASHLDGGLMRLRLDPDDPHAADCLAAASDAISVLSAESVVCMVEPTWWRGRGAQDGPDVTTRSGLRAVTAAAALGSRSAYTWLVLPIDEARADIVKATTLPLLVRIADAPDTPLDVESDSWRRSLEHPGVRGLVVPATRLFPPTGEPLTVLDAAAAAVSSSAGRAGN